MRDRYRNADIPPQTPYLDALGITRPRGPGRPARERCKQCEGHIVNVGSLSRRGLCLDCATRNMGIQQRTIRAKAELERIQKHVARISGG